MKTLLAFAAVAILMTSCSRFEDGEFNNYRAPLSGVHLDVKFSGDNMEVIGIAQDYTATRTGTDSEGRDLYSASVELIGATATWTYAVEADQESFTETYTKTIGGIVDREESRFFEFYPDYRPNM